MPIRMICIDKSLKKRGPSYLAAGGRYQIGRSSQCAFSVSDLSVSRIHAEITASDKDLILKDLRSRNGTYVNGIRVEVAELKPGQLVRFGNVRFQIVGGLSDDESPRDSSNLSTHCISGEPAHQPAAMLQLSPAQLAVLRLLLTGLAEKEIAAKIHSSPHTVHTHVKEIFRKMNVNSRAELLALFMADPNGPESPAK